MPKDFLLLNSIKNQVFRHRYIINSTILCQVISGSSVKFEKFDWLKWIRSWNCNYIRGLSAWKKFVRVMMKLFGKCPNIEIEIFSMWEPLGCFISVPLVPAASSHTFRKTLQLWQAVLKQSFSPIFLSLTWQRRNMC